jgi:hypothetical protein
MINVAKQEMEKNNVAIEFIVGDCSQVCSYGEFDIYFMFFIFILFNFILFSFRYLFILLIRDKNKIL